MVKAVNSVRKERGLLPLAQLTLPGGKPVFFAGEMAEGPIRLSSGEIGDGIHSAFAIGKLLTRVRDTPEEVAEVIKAAKGKAKKPSEFVGMKRKAA
ncbi:hypothetical protein AJ87_24330 [Rhizobium yanglingense]|nr:hypothetical protein AJ87_24330 [Rhizobium yanglingense]